MASDTFVSIGCASNDGFLFGLDGCATASHLCNLFRLAGRMEFYADCISYLDFTVSSHALEKTPH